MRQRASARSHRAPLGASGRPTGTRTWCHRGPSCRPGHRLRSTCCRRSCALPSRGPGSPIRGTRWRAPVAPAVPMRAMMARTRSFAVTPLRRTPETSIANDFGLRCSRHCVASTWPTSLVPMPNASAPNAPWVLVWLSPHTMVVPGWREAQLGADDVDDSLPGVATIEEPDAELGAVAHECVHLGLGVGRCAVPPWRWRDPPWRRYAPAFARVSRAAAARRRPGATSPRGSDGGRHRGSPAHLRRRR